MAIIRRGGMLGGRGGTRSHQPSAWRINSSAINRRGGPAGGDVGRKLAEPRHQSAVSRRGIASINEIAALCANIATKIVPSSTVIARCRPPLAVIAANADRISAAIASLMRRETRPLLAGLNGLSYRPAPLLSARADRLAVSDRPALACLLVGRALSL